jgi:hypothetical protein
MKKALLLALAALLMCGAAYAQDQSFQAAAGGGAVVISATDCTNQLIEDIGTDGTGTCKTVTLAGPQFANQGTTTTVPHGNAAGNPTWAAVVSADLNITTTSCSNQFVTAISAGGVGTCTSDTLASAQHANEGTTITVLHGNGSGNPTWASVNLAAEVGTSKLPKANGGLGYAPAATTCTASSFGTGAIQALSDDESGTCVITGNNSAVNGTLTITFSQTATTGWRCIFTPDDGATDWVNGAFCKTNDRTTTTSIGACSNINTTGTGTNLANASAYWVTYRCMPY